MAAQSLSKKDKRFIVKVIKGEGAYKKLSKFDRVEVLNDYFSTRGAKILQPKFIRLMNGEIELDKWVENDAVKVENRRGEMALSYIEGTYEGVVRAATEDKNIHT